jgi:integrase
VIPIKNIGIFGYHISKSIVMVGTINFVLRSQKTLKSGLVPVYLTYSIHRARIFYSVDAAVYPGNWDEGKRRACYLTNAEAKERGITKDQLLMKSEVDAINDTIQQVIMKIDAIEKKFGANDIAFSSEMVINELKGKQSAVTKKEERKGLVFDWMDKYITEHETIREKGSLSVYNSVKNHLKAYQDETSHKVTFESIDNKFFQSFQRFLVKRTKKDKAGNVSPMLNNTTIAKALSTLKTFLGYAKDSGIEISDSYRDFTIKKEKLEVIALTQEEFDSLLKMDLSKNERLDKVRDLFVFSCSTGFRHSDVAQLKREHINEDEIKLTVKKTKTSLMVPLNVISAGILDKYKNQHKPLPVASNQFLNRELKSLCKSAGIDQPIEIVRFHGAKRVAVTYPKYELIHFHTGRKTFCTLSLEKGMAAQDVMAISGHTDYKSFARYVNVTEKRKKVVMLKAWGEVPLMKVV